MTATAAPLAPRTTHQQVPDARLRFTGVLRSEWIKLTTLRSTVWAYLVLVAVQIGMGLVLALTIDRGPTDVQSATDLAVQVSALGVFLGQLVIAVLGVLVVSSEYSTGQIRSTLTSVPHRTAVLWAKAIVFGVTSFVVSLVSIVISYAVTWPILSGIGTASDPWDTALWGGLLGAAGYVALIGLVSFGVGAILRHTAGGIAAAVGLILVLPTVLGLIGTQWASVLSDWLPASAGQNLFLPGGTFEPWQAALVMLGWIAVLFTAAAILLRRRDA